MATIYRKAALERLASPEQLDKLVRATSPMSWLIALGTALILAVTLVWSIFGKLPETVMLTGVLAGAGRTQSVYAEAPGRLEYLVNKGEEVAAGQIVAHISDGTGDGTDVAARVGGTVTALTAQDGQILPVGAELLRIYADERGDKSYVLCFVPPVTAKKLASGMETAISLATVDEQKYGHMLGKIGHVDAYSATAAEMLGLLGDEQMVSALLEQGASVLVEIKPDEDASTVNGYAWSNVGGGGLPVSRGTPVSVRVITAENAPISKLFPYFAGKLDGERE